MKNFVDQSTIQNKLLHNLDKDLFNTIRPYLTRSYLKQSQSIEISHESISQVCFPESGVISVVANSPSGTRLETGLIGLEGMTGTSLLYGIEITPNDTFVQIPCHVLQISTSNFRAVLIDSRALHLHLLRYAYVYSIQVAQTALCNSLCTIEQRLARWLLMCQDRTNSNDIMLTHQFLAVMLGVRRAGVTTAIRDFVIGGAINIQRGMIVVRNRDLLLSLAGNAYGSAEKSYAAIMETK